MTSSLNHIWESSRRPGILSTGFGGAAGLSADMSALGEMGSPMTMPPVANPVHFLDKYTNEESPDYKIKIAHGTTTLGFKYQGGVVICVDSRATAGNYVASQSVKKVIEINPYLLGTMAGGAADCAYWERELGRRCRLHELRNKERISVAAASKLLANMVFSYRGMGLSMGTMVTGWDKTGPVLHYVDSDAQRLKGNMFSVGSGSTHAYGVLDGAYHYDLTESEAIDLGRRAIYHATYRDAFSGGSVRVYHVDREGWRFVGIDDVYDLHYKYADMPKPELKASMN